MESELTKVRTATLGTRNLTLHIVAIKLGQMVLAGELAEDDVRAALTCAGIETKLSAREVAKTINKGFRKVMLIPTNGYPDVSTYDNIPEDAKVLFRAIVLGFPVIQKMQTDCEMSDDDTIQAALNLIGNRLAKITYDGKQFKFVVTASGLEVVKKISDGDCEIKEG